MFKVSFPKPGPCPYTRFLIVGCGLLLLCGALAYSQSPNDERLPAGPAEPKAEAACLSCHEARIIVQQRLSKAAWTKEVDKMVKWGSEVDPLDRDALIDYLSANFSADEAAYNPPRTAAKSNAKSGGNAKRATTQHPQDSH